MITLERAKELQYGDILVDKLGKRWKVNGQVLTWKNNPNWIKIPLKNGLYAFEYIDEHNFVNGECSSLTLEDEYMSIDDEH